MAGLADLGIPVKQSKVTDSLDNLIITIYGGNGTGKTVQASKFEKPLFFAFGRSGLTGLPGVNFISVKSWSDWKKYVRQFADPKNYEDLKADVQTIVLDEIEILYKYCETYVAATNEASSIRSGNSGYGLWRELSDEWNKELLQIFGAGFTVVNIIHCDLDENGKANPRGDKRMLEHIMNHSDIIAYAQNNGLSPDGVPVHSSLILADSKDGFARTRNEWVGKLHPVISEFTAANLINAYRDGVKAQAEHEGVAVVSREEREEMFEVERIPFSELKQQAIDACNEAQEILGDDKVFDVIDEVLGTNKRLSDCTEKQWEAVSTIITELENLMAAAEGDS